MARSSRRSSKRTARSSTVFRRHNYLLLLVGVALIVVGFSVMAFESELKGFLSLYVAPLLIMGGYFEIIYAILWRPGEEKVEEPQAEH